MNEKSEKKSGSRAATTRPDSRRGMSKGQIRKVRRDRSRARKNRRRNLLMFDGILIALVFLVIAFVVFVERGQRRLPIHMHKKCVAESCTVVKKVIYL